MKNTAKKKVIVPVVIVCALCICCAVIGLCGCERSSEEREEDITEKSERIAEVIDTYVDAGVDCAVTVRLGTGHKVNGEYKNGDKFCLTLKAGSPKLQMIEAIKASWLKCKDFPYREMELHYKYNGDPDYWVADRKFNNLIIDITKDQAIEQQQANANRQESN